MESISPTLSPAGMFRSSPVVTTACPFLKTYSRGISPTGTSCMVAERSLELRNPTASESPSRTDSRTAGFPGMRTCARSGSTLPMMPTRLRIPGVRHSMTASPGAIPRELPWAMVKELCQA